MQLNVAHAMTNPTRTRSRIGVTDRQCSSVIIAGTESVLSRLLVCRLRSRWHRPVMAPATRRRSELEQGSSVSAVVVRRWERVALTLDLQFVLVDSTTWTYLFTPEATGTRVTHSYDVTLPPLRAFIALYRRVMPQHFDMRPAMTDNLTALKSIAEHENAAPRLTSTT